MAWIISLHPHFELELAKLPDTIQDELVVQVGLLRAYGPALKRPHADTLKGSKHANMKELRFSSMGGAWRIAYVFDPMRRGILLVAGDKSGIGQTRFYREFIRRADNRYDHHLKAIMAGRDPR